MSELTEYLAHKYNNMSKESKSETGLTYNPAYLGGYRKCVVDAQEYKPTLNENQQIVLEYLKTDFGKHEIFVKSIFEPIQELLFNCWDDEVDTAFEQLDLKQEIQVLEAFSQYVLEQEEE